MAITITCDGGCGTSIALHPKNSRHDDRCRGCLRGHDGLMRGQLDQACYCAACAVVFDAHDAAERVARVAAVQQFEDWRRQARRVLRETLKKLPDDWEAEEPEAGHGP